jgi:hypothetical protein
MEKGYAAVPTPDAKQSSKELIQRASDKTPERIWHDALGFLQAELPRQFFDTWVRDVEPISFDDDLLTLNVANEFAREKLEKEYKETILRTLSMVLGHAIEVQIVVNYGMDTGHESTSILGAENDLNGHSLTSFSQDIPSDDQRLEIMFQFRRYWEMIVDPEKVVSIGRYFVKYWLPILGPDFSSMVLAFKQLRYLHDAGTNEPFSIYVSELLQWQGISKSTFYRRLEDPHPLLAWFIEEAPSVGVYYENPKPGRIRQKPKQYIVYGGTPLSPPHHRVVHDLLLKLGAGTDPEKTLSALETVLKIPNQELRKLLDDSFQEYMEKGHADHPKQALSVLDITRELLGFSGEEGVSMGQISILAEELENRLVRPDQVINLTWYFVREWQSLLKNASFWLIILLRSMGFYDRRTSEIRNTFWIDGGFSELGEKIGVSSETISGWFGGNRKSHSSSQSGYISQFVQEIERTRGRNGNNHRSISVKLSVEMIDPLTPTGELQFLNFINTQGDIDPIGSLDDLEDIPENWDSSDIDLGNSPEIRDSSSSNYPEKRDPTKPDSPEFWDSIKSDIPEKRDSIAPDSPDFWDRIKDSINTSSKQRTKNVNTLENTTPKSVNQLLLPLIYSSKSVKNKDPDRRSSGWNFEELLRASMIPPKQAEDLQQRGISGGDFAAWVLYAYSEEGRGIKKPGFFAARRLLEDPSMLAQERWRSLAGSGPGFVIENIQRAMDPIGEDVEREWGDAMGKVPRVRLEQLARDLCLEVVLKQP